MWECVTDFRGDERTFPIRLKFFTRNHDGLGVVVEERDANLVAQFRVGLHEFAQAIHDTRQIELRAENQIGFAVEPVPEYELEFVLQKPREHPVRAFTDELTELPFGGNDAREIFLLIVRRVLEHLIGLVLWRDFARLRLVVTNIWCRLLLTD